MAAPLLLSFPLRVMVAVDQGPAGRALVRRGWRMAAALKGELHVVYVEPTQGHRRTRNLDEERALRKTLQLADELGATVVRLRGKVAEELIAYVEAHGMTQVVIGHPTHGRWEELLRGSVTSQLLRSLKGVDIHVVAAPGETSAQGK